MLKFETPSPVTQSVEAVVELLKRLNREVKPLPLSVRLSRSVVLVLSRKGDVYYTTTKTACSCPDACYRHHVCKHQREFFPAPEESIKPRGGFVPAGPEVLPSGVGFAPKTKCPASWGNDVRCEGVI